MDSRLKQRLIGAAVLVALAVIFLPMLVQGPAPDSGVSDVPLSMPDAPRGAYETRDLPLVTPGNAPDGGAVGMSSSAAAPVTPPPVSDQAAVPTPIPDDSNAAGTTASTATTTAAVSPVPADAAPTVTKPATPSSGEMLPPATAGGDYAVSFGSYGTTTAADAVVGSLRASQLPGYREPVVANGKSAWRVRIGPYASRAQAEAARLRAAHVRDDLGASVVVLDAQTPAPTPAKPATPATPAATTVASASGSHAATSAAPAVATTAPAAAPTAPAATPAAAAVGFAVQLAAFSKPADATALRDRLRAAGISAFSESVSTDHGTLTRVRAGPVQSRAEAEQLQAQIKSKLGLDGVIRPHP
ncbi:MAG TPA: SPOR domain-containing protein [Luteimonas sp.]|nr:SPOR domain-containing protein [Luteimonas sp.]